MMPLCAVHHLVPPFSLVLSDDIEGSSGGFSPRVQGAGLG